MRGDPGQIKETNMDEKIAVLTDTNSGITPEQAGIDRTRDSHGTDSADQSHPPGCAGDFPLLCPAGRCHQGHLRG